MCPQKRSIDDMQTTYAQYTPEQFRTTQDEINKAWSSYISSANNYSLAIFFVKFFDLCRVNLYRNMPYININIKKRNDLDGKLVLFMNTLQSQRNQIAHMGTVPLTDSLINILSADYAIQALKIIQQEKYVDFAKLPFLLDIFNGEVLEMISTKGSVKPYGRKHPDVDYGTNRYPVQLAIYNYSIFGSNYPNTLKERLEIKENTGASSSK